MSYRFKDLAVDVLGKIKKAMSPVDIWEKGIELGLAQKVRSKGKTPWRSIGSQIYVEIKDKGEKSRFVKIDEGIFALNNGEKYDSIEVFTSDVSNENIKYDEKDLHKLLVTFVGSDESFRCHCQTIDDKTSEKKEKGESKWLHPDIVGVQYFFENQTYKNDDSRKKVIDLMKVHGDSTFKLFSFEIKKELDLGTLREKFFQAVSNSSWANEGYLVALTICEKENFRRELKRLCNSFGIGVIQLNVQNIFQSEIIYPARYREFVDWDTVNALNSVNGDFKIFIQNVLDSVRTQRLVGEKNFDETFNDEDEAQQYAKEKGMVN